MSDDFSAFRISRQQMAWRAAQDIEANSYVNLGIGMPVLCANHLPAGKNITFQSENGVLGFRGAGPGDVKDFDLINASKDSIVLMPGASIVHHADSFAMINGGHIDIAVLGAFQVAQNGNLANWSTGPGGVPAVGGAMDLATGAREVRVLTAHTAKGAIPKLVAECTMPLTGAGVVKRVYTDLAVIEVGAEGFILREIVPGLSPEALQEVTGAPLIIKEPPGALSPPAGL